YSVLYQANDKQIFIAKQPPKENGSSNSELFYKVGINLDFPPLEELKEISNDTALISSLNNILGISPNINIPEEQSTRQALEATITHARFYLFQKQGVIANQDILFHRQSDQFIPQSIKDTLPYFLGAIQEDRLKLLQELRIAKRQLALLKRKLDEAEMIACSEINLAQDLFYEAQQIGVISSEACKIEDIMTCLKEALDWVPEKYEFENMELLVNLKSKLAEIEENIQYKTEQILAAKSFSKEAEGFSNEVQEQALRLESINLFPIENSTEDHICPLCSSHVEESVPSISVLNKSLLDLKRMLGNVSRERPKLREYIQSLYDERESLKNNAKQLHEQITKLYEEYDEARNIRDKNARIGKVIGKISLYLESVDTIDELSPLQSDVNEAEKLVEYFENLLDKQEVEDRLTSILNYLGSLMSGWAEELELEHKGSPYRLDINKLTVVADRNGKPVFMNKNMGGGSNWLGCHIIALAALHKYFILEKRPVPNFLILDQPTQVYFPPEKYKKMEGKTEEVSDEDRVAVSRLFNFLFNLCDLLDSNLQIIVTEHANLENERFQAALVGEPWRGNQALIPQSWLI
ncbi:MAG: DUF3732 domain-containing protein, partial [Sporomusaceae bacterium]|nr:DUF3732 domain-containing protein [Sporomusaceae bacterium]